MKKIIAFLILVPFISHAQKATLSGKITDANLKEDIIGVTVLIKGTSMGAITDLNGRYEIKNIAPGTYTMEVSYLGYKRQLITGVKLVENQNLIKNFALQPTSLTVDQEIVIIGNAELVDIEQTKSQQQVSSEAIDAAPVRQIQGILNTQTGVVLNPEGISIRGGRTYETAFLIDGVSASDPLAGTGFGIDLGSNSINKINITTGGGDASFGDGTAGIVQAETKRGGDKWEGSIIHRRDNLGINGLSYATSDHVWNNETYEATLGGSVKIGKKKNQRFRVFTSFKSSFDDQYFKSPANQVKSSIYPNTALSPTQDNRWAGNLKLSYDFNAGTKLEFSYIKSITINQDVNMLRITGNDVPFLPGLQYNFILQPDNANTYTHDTNLETLKWSQTTSNKFSYQITASRLYVKLRADANGRDWRPQNVDSEFDPNTIVSFPVSYFNPQDSVVFVTPGPGLYNNGGIATLWHSHYVEEYTLRLSCNYYYGKTGNRINYGTEYKRQALQWIDIQRPWIGAPITLADGSQTQSFRLGDYSDVWTVKPTRGAFYGSNKIKYRGLIADIGLRAEYWFPGKYVDERINDERSPIRDEVRQNYVKNSLQLGNRNFKARFLPKISASFPIKENQVMFFNYNHSMILPHPSFIYAGLDPYYQDRSTLARVGNPDLNPEVDISYELGLRSQITTNDVFNVTAYWKDKYDFITSASVQIKDATGREVTRTMRINSDYARVRGIELSYIKRISSWFTSQVSFAYSVSTGQSSSANEALKNILNSGNREDTREIYLAWDSPIDFKTFAIANFDNKEGYFGLKHLNRMSFYLEGVYRTGRRYTPYTLVGYESINDRPLYEENSDPNLRWSELGAANYWVDFNYRKWFVVKKMRLDLILEVTNVLNTRNTIIPNPVTGSAYQEGDPVPSSWRDPNYLDPRDSRSGNLPPDNPARLRAPRHIMFGVGLKF